MDSRYIFYFRGTTPRDISTAQKIKMQRLRTWNNRSQLNDSISRNLEKALKFLKWMTYFKHRKGVLAGEFIDPHPIQIFIFANIYGWAHKDTGYRRFKYAYWQVARKNAKSQSLACVASYEASAFGEYSAEVYCAATKTAQAKRVLLGELILEPDEPSDRKSVV